MSALDPITPNPALPTIFHAGDSLSIGMVPELRVALDGEVNVLRPPENCQDTERWLVQLEREWLNPTRNWSYELVLFNAGLWDVNQTIMTDVATYEANIEAIVAILQARCRRARLVWVNTSYVGPGAVNRDNADVIAYNAAAAGVMAAAGIGVVDMYAATFANYGTWYDPDDVHLTEPGYVAAAAVLEARVRLELGLG